MRIATRDRLWLIGGIVVALLLVATAWQFMIKGQHDQTASVNQDIATAQQKVLDSTHQLNLLRADSANLDKYKAQLAADQAALPSDAGLPAFIRELHAAGDATGVAIISLSIAQPAAIVGQTSVGAAAQEIPITLVVSGPTDKVTAFIKQLQSVQPRAVLLATVSESPSSANQVQASLSFKAFVVPSRTAPTTS